MKKMQKRCFNAAKALFALLLVFVIALRHLKYSDKFSCNLVTSLKLKWKGVVNIEKMAMSENACFGHP